MSESEVPGEPPERRRRPRLTPVLAAGIAKCLLDGNYRFVAAKRFGVTPRTFQRWMQNGIKFPDGVYGYFRRLVLEAEAACEAAAVAAIVSQGRAGDGRLLLEYLARRYPSRYGAFRGELGQLVRRVRELEALLDAYDRQASALQTDRDSQRPD